MTDDFLKCIEVVLKAEGGYVNHPSDPGGETNFGICKRYYPHLDIKNLTKEDAIHIYFRDYWLPMNLKGIIDLTAVLEIFDMGVNAGIRTAIKMAQRLVGAYPDGKIGVITTAKINECNGFTDAYKFRRRKFYKTLANKKPELAVFLKGWLNRVDNCHL